LAHANLGWSEEEAEAPMKPRLVDYLFIILTVLFTVYGQLIVKWRVAASGIDPQTPGEHLHLVGRMLMDPLILSSLFAGFLAAACWFVAMTKFQLSYAYPFTSLNFVLVLLLSAALLKEPLNLTRVAGVALIIVGTIVASRS
jgi:drug/metabolite transporter (DMT)-like permease